jgi:hypothetical protein
VIYFAGYKHPEDVFKRDDIEAATDQVIWASDVGPAIEPRRPQDRALRGNIVQAMLAYAEGRARRASRSRRCGRRASSRSAATA